jgi:hypothetical protein
MEEEFEFTEPTENRSSSSSNEAEEEEIGFRARRLVLRVESTEQLLTKKPAVFSIPVMYCNILKILMPF